MAGDWLKLHRKSLESQVFSDDFLWRLWCWCLMRSNWKRGWVDGQEISPGQFVTGKIAAAEQLNVSPSKWYRGIKRLEKLGQISVKANNRWTTISLCNWETYQNENDRKPNDVDNGWTTDGQRMDSQWTASGQPVDTIEEGKEIKEGKDSSGTAAAAPVKKFKFDPQDMAIAEWMLTRIRDVVPGAICKSKNSWANEIRLIRERDGRTALEIKELFAWANQDQFWSTNILSPQKLRSQWTSLSAKRGKRTVHVRESQRALTLDEQAAAARARRERQNQGGR